MGVCEIGCDLEQVAVGIAEVDGYYLTEGAGAVDGTLFDGDVERLEVGDGLFGGIGGDEAEVGGACSGVCGFGVEGVV